MSFLASYHSPRMVLIQNFKQLEIWSSQTAVHRKIFEFAITQLRHFVQSLNDSYDSLGDRSDAISTDIISDFRDFYLLIRQNLISTWTGTTLENSCSYVIDQIFVIFESIISKIKKHIPETHFDLLLDTESDQWDEYNALDLKAIEASFSQCLSSTKENTQFHYLLSNKLKSIQSKLEKYSTTSISRIFSPIPVNYQSWRVNLNDFTTLKEIGRGITAQVFLAKDNRPGIDPADTNVAIKIFDRHKLNGSRFQSFQREVAVLATMQHPALMNLVGATDTPPYCIITKWMPNGSLFTDLNMHHRLDETMRTIAAFDIARGMQYMHSRQIAHRDLKSLNVLLDKDLHIKVCDFGFSRHTDDTSLMTSNIGTPHWMAPELFKKGVPYTGKVDVYAYGIVLWEIATSQLPYFGMESQAIIRQVTTQNLRPEITNEIKPEVANLMRRCWDEDPAKRPTFDEIVKLFKTNKIILNNANKEIVSKYIEESATTGEALDEEIERRMKNYKDGKMKLMEAFRPLEKNRMPNTSVDICWSSIELAYKKLLQHLSNGQKLNTDSEGETPSNLAKLFLYFISSSKYSDVVNLLRHLPRNSVPTTIISKFVEDIPTGSKQIDLDITIAACKNNAADLCAVFAIDPKHVSFCLDVASQTNIDPQLKEAVIDKCVASLRYDDDNLIAASIRCLLVLGDFKRISMEMIRKFIKSDNKTIVCCSLLTITSFSLADCDIPDDIIDIVIKNWDDKVAKSTLVALCKRENAALKIINYLENIADSIQADPFLLKILIQAVKHKRIKQKIKKIVCLLNFDSLLNDFEPAVSFLKRELG